MPDVQVMKLGRGKYLANSLTGKRSGVEVVTLKKRKGLDDLTNGQVVG